MKPPPTAPPAPSNDDESDFIDLQQLLRSHNKKVLSSKTAPVFKPHTVRDVREWEKRCGKVYAKLGKEERVGADKEIREFKGR